MAKLLNKLSVQFNIPDDTPGILLNPAGHTNAPGRNQTSELYIKDFRLGHVAEWAAYHWLRLSGRDPDVKTPSTVCKQNKHDVDLVGTSNYHIKHISRRGTPSYVFQGSAIPVAPTYEDGVFTGFPDTNLDEYLIGVDVRLDKPLRLMSEEKATVTAHIRHIARMSDVVKVLEYPDKEYLTLPHMVAKFGPELALKRAKWVAPVSKLPKNFKDPGEAPMKPLKIEPSSALPSKPSVDPIAFDTETELFGPGDLAPRMICLSAADENDAVLLTHLEALDFVRGMLTCGRTIVGLNVAYDMAVLCREYPELTQLVFDAYVGGRVRDVMLDQKLIDIAEGTSAKYRNMRGGYSMKSLCKRLLRIDIEKEGTPRLEYWRLRYRPISDYSEAEILYSIKDARYTFNLHQHQEEVSRKWAEKHGVGLFADAPRQAFHAFSLHLATCHGVRTHPTRCSELQHTLDEEITRARALLEEHGLVRPDGTRDMKAARARMVEVCAAKGIEPGLTDKGGIKLDQEATSSSGDEVLQAYSTFVGANTLRARVQGLALGAEQTLHPAYRTLMDTGRTSCSKSFGSVPGVQIQNMPRLEGSRECLEPGVGKIFVSADFTAAEMYGLAQSCKDLVGRSILGDLLNNGQDPHVYLGAALFNMTYEEVMASPDKKKIRQAAKPLSFGAPGGLGAATFVKYAAAYGVSLTVETAREHLALYREVYPEVADYLRYCSEHLECYGEVYYGWSGRWRGGLIYTNMANGFFQARIADAALHSLDLVQLEAYCNTKSPLYGSRVWGFIHDEILMETPVTRARKAAARLQELMEEGFRKYHPDYPTRAEAALHWRWSKGVEPAFNEDGDLVISDPENAPAWYKGGKQ